MKKNLHILLVVAGLFSAGSLSAHTVDVFPTGATLLRHDHPAFEEVSTLYRLYEDSTHDTITVIWTAKKACPNAATLVQEYDVTVTRTQSTAATYSLWTLGFQSDDPSVITEVTLKGPGTWQVAESATQTTLRAPNPTEKIAGTGMKKPYPTMPNYQIVEDTNIWLAQFTGTSFTFTVKRSGRPGETRWSPTVFQCGATANGHDNTPPH
jgi:hypothetical protein